MTKKELLTKINGKSATYSNSMFHLDHERTNRESIESLTEMVNKWNAENPDKKPQKVEVNREMGTIEVGTQIWRLAKPAKTGVIDVRASYISVCGVRVDPKDIDMDSVTENSFKTIHGSTVVFQ